MIRWSKVCFAALMLISLLSAVGNAGEGVDSDGKQFARGPHGGRLLSEGEFSLEIILFEEGVPPEFRAYPFISGKPLSPEEVRATINLERFEKKEEFTLSVRDNYLWSAKEVTELHSFVVTVVANYRERNYEWRYEAFEGRTEIQPEIFKETAVEILTAGSATIRDEYPVYGKIRAPSNRVLHVKPRFSGIVKEVLKGQGDKVSIGDALLVVESDQSLTRYDINTQIAGEITERRATIGEHASEGDTLFVVSDLSEIWVDFQIFSEVAIQKGQVVTVKVGEQEYKSPVSYISPTVDEATQSTLVRVVLSNKDGKLRPGLFVTGMVSTAEAVVPLAVSRSALQNFRKWQVVFATDGTVFQAMPVELGKGDSQYVEVLSGITPGTKYVSTGSYLIKADIEKSGASHDH